jgi:hypothetical protein
MKKRLYDMIFNRGEGNQGRGHKGVFKKLTQFL